MARGGKRPGAGRPKGSVNREHKMLKEAILEAAEKAGGNGGIVAYLTRQAAENPKAFLALLGRVLPMQVEGTGPEGAIRVTGLNVKFVGPADGKDG